MSKWKSFLWLVLAISLLALAGCLPAEDQPASQQPPVAAKPIPATEQPEAPAASAPETPPLPQPPPIPAGPSPTVSHIVENARELREEKTYFATLHSQKHQLSLSLWKHIKNAASAVEHDVLIGESTYNEWTEGQELADKFDGVGLFADGEWASYRTEVKRKWFISDYSWVDKDGTRTEIGEQDYRDALRLVTESRPTLTVPYSNLVSTYVLERPLSEYVFTKKEPLTRYFVTVKIENSSITLSLTKALRNATTASEIAFEVPKSVYESASEVWEPGLNVNSAILKGRLSTLHGTITSRRSQVDPNYQLATTANGESFIIPIAK